MNLSCVCVCVNVCVSEREKIESKRGRESERVVEGKKRK